MNKISVIWNKKDLPDLEKRAAAISDDLCNILKLNSTINKAITIRIHPSRKSYDKQLNRNTMDWEVGNTSNNNTIDILHPDAFERYSSHKKLEFDSILKHEMAHVYVQEMTNKKYIPYWLNEGLAMYLADQIHKYTENGYFIEKDFTSKLSSEYDWDKRANNDAYAISCLFTNYLVKTYSLDKVLDFIMHLDKNFYEPLFNKKFQNTFGASLTNVENEFAIKINN